MATIPPGLQALPSLLDARPESTAIAGEHVRRSFPPQGQCDAPAASCATAHSRLIQNQDNGASRRGRQVQGPGSCGEPEELGEAVAELELLVLRGCRASSKVLYRVLRRCVEAKDLALGRRVHSMALASGYGADAFLANHVIRMYAALGELGDAVQVFAAVAEPNVYMWSSIILAHARQGRAAEAVGLYRRMREAGARPDNHIFAAVLKACTEGLDLGAGKEVHRDMEASGVEGDVFVGNSLVNMYAKCGSLGDARRVFDGLGVKDVVSWTAMIAGYAQQGRGEEALGLYGRMQESGVVLADQVTFVCLLQACARLRALEEGRELHLRVRERVMEGDAVVGNCLVTMYARCGCLEEAREVFDGLVRRDVVTWNAMIAAYSQQGLGREALALYGVMEREGVAAADHVTFLGLIQACGSVGALRQGMEVHSQICERGLDADVFIGSCLVDMYAKCGSLEDARRVFDGLCSRVVVTWNALINGHAQNGDGEMAIRCFEEMVEEGVEPDETTFISLFVACSHAGLVEAGKEYFRMMVEEYRIGPTQHHYSCMVDLLGRSGRLDEAENVLRTTSLVNEVVGWTALLSACKGFCDVERGVRCFDRLVELEADDASSYVLLGTIYANAGRWDDVGRIEGLRKSAGAMKKAAKAYIEVKNKVHEFTVGEQRSDLSSQMKSLQTKLKVEGGHVPQTELVLRAVSEQEKEDALCGHAEKLALAFGLLNTPDGTSLIVTKNLRMCNDCHSSTKIMSHLEKREIIVRDAHRVHRFVEGVCSCGDRH